MIARRIRRAGICIVLLGVLFAQAAVAANACLAADASTPPESRSAPQITTPLKEFVSEALQDNPEIQAARKEREAAQHRVSPAGALDELMAVVKHFGR